MSYTTTDNLRDLYQHIGFYLVDKFPDIDEENMGYEEIDEALIKSVNDDTTDIAYLFIGKGVAFHAVQKLLYIRLRDAVVNNPLFAPMHNDSVGKYYYTYTTNQINKIVNFIRDESPENLGLLTEEEEKMPLRKESYTKFYEEMAALCKRAINENKKICAYIHEFEQD